MVPCRCGMQDGIRGREVRPKHGVHCPWRQQLIPEAQGWTSGFMPGEAHSLAPEEGGRVPSVASTGLCGQGSTYATCPTTAFSRVLIAVEKPAHFRVRQELRVWL